MACTGIAWALRHFCTDSPRVPAEVLCTRAGISATPQNMSFESRSLSIPRHIAIIMDGNGRWAEARSQVRIEGHRQGAVRVREVVRACRELGVEALTLYAFSEQNWARPDDEVTGLMQLLHDYVVGEREEILTHGIRFRVIGRTHKLPAFLHPALGELGRASLQNEGMTLTIALSYGSRESILDACREALRLQRTGDDFSLEDLSSLLPNADLPPLDLLIRTGGEKRLSNFMLWEAAYAELHFAEALWPDFTRAELDAALRAYSGRERRFGRTSAQLSA